MQEFSTNNLLADFQGEVNAQVFLGTYKNKILQESEKLFVTDFLYPLLGQNIRFVVPQYVFIDSEGHSRKIDFALVKDSLKLAMEVNGEYYHAEGIIPNEVFDDNLFRQNEILNQGWKLIRVSYNQLLDSSWRERVSNTLHVFVARNLPGLISEDAIKPHYIQVKALEALDFYRSKGWGKGLIVLPTGLGKTFLSAFDSRKVLNVTQGRALFVVHRLDILSQSKNAFEMVWPDATLGLLTGESKENVSNSNILFASKDTLKNPDVLSLFATDEFDYIIIDEVHHGEAPSYQPIFKHFKPKFLLGMTATPDRMDRKDIFELFDYNKVFEYTVHEAIENGFLVPFTYYGLKDNIDYSHIRYNGHKYNTQDLERYLIIEKRNEQILYEYINKAKGNKAIGFCCSIKHAERMAEYFNSQGVPAVAITSISDSRSKDLADFRDNKYAVAFTVDLFNEGMDFPNVQALLFLRPTESKTVFMQQLGRGLRLSTGKDRLIVLDFISNYKKANKLRDYLAKSKLEKLTPSGRIEKIEYRYVPECQVVFDGEVEELLDRQDREERGVSKEDLLEAYFKLAEKLGRRPTHSDLNNEGEYKVSKYIAIFGSWIRFLRDAGEYTEASYHYPQGVHLGHILYIVKTLAEAKQHDSHIDPKYVRIRGNLDEGRLATFQRQTKYKLQALMEMGIINDDRGYGHEEEYILELTPEGKSFYKVLLPVIATVDLSFVESKDDIPSWDMKLNPQEFNKAIWDFLKQHLSEQVYIQKFFLQTIAVSQMLNYIYKIERKTRILKATIYQGFFLAPFVKQHCEQVGIELATEEGARHRCPFLLNILESIGVITQATSEIQVNIFLNCQQIMQLHPRESEFEVLARVKRIGEFYNGKTPEFEDSESSLLKENFGGGFLTKEYFLQKFSTI